jgi:hypothetical protein
MTPVALLGGEGQVIVPPQERAKIEAALRASKMSVTEANVRTSYLTAKMKEVK